MQNSLVSMIIFEFPLKIFSCLSMLILGSQWLSSTTSQKTPYPITIKHFLSPSKFKTKLANALLRSMLATSYGTPQRSSSSTTFPLLEMWRTSTWAWIRINISLAALLLSCIALDPPVATLLSFYRYETPEEAYYAVKVLNESSFNGTIIKVERDWGFSPDRQYARGKNGCQVWLYGRIIDPKS